MSITPNQMQSAAHMIQVCEPELIMKREKSILQHSPELLVPFNETQLPIDEGGRQV